MKLENISKYVSDKILWNLVDENNFISTDNMIPNKGGVIKSEYLPQKGYIYAYKKGDILLSNIRPYFKKVWLADKDGGCSSDILVLRPIKVTPEYLYAVLSQDRFFQYDMAGTKGSKMPRGDKKHIMNFPVLKLKNTIKIGYILQILNQKIELNNKINTELEAMAKTIYDYWFLQFEFPNEEGKPYKSSGGKMVWNEELKREIPEGWSNGFITNLGEIFSGGTPSTKHGEYYTKNGIAWITPYDLSSTTNKYITHGQRDISQKGLENSSAQLMPKGSILLTSRAPIGYICIALNQVTTNQGFKSIVPYNKSNSEYIYYLLKSLIPYLKTLGSGSTFAEISKEKLSNITIILPNSYIIEKFNNIAINLGKMRAINEQENQKLSSLRDFLLPLLMNGQVGFKD